MNSKRAEYSCFPAPKGYRARRRCAAVTGALRASSQRRELLPTPIDFDRLVIRATHELGAGAPSSPSLSTASREAVQGCCASPTSRECLRRCMIAGGCHRDLRISRSIRSSANRRRPNRSPLSVFTFTLQVALERTAVRVPGPPSRQPDHRTVPQGKSRHGTRANGWTPNRGVARNGEE